MFRDKKIIVLEMKSALKDENIDVMEDKLSKKFGCKVILLPPTIGCNIQIIK